MLEEERLKRKEFERLQAEKEAQFRGNSKDDNLTNQSFTPLP